MLVCQERHPIPGFHAPHGQPTTRYITGQYALAMWPRSPSSNPFTSVDRQPPRFRALDPPIPDVSAVRKHLAASEGSRRGSCGASVERKTQDTAKIDVQNLLRNRPDQEV
jgi:hypothetical protein